MDPITPRFRFLCRLATSALLGFVLAACGGGGGSSEDDPPVLSRSFYMGFTPFPYNADPATLSMVVDDIYARLATDADMVLHHLEEGIPWNAALADDLLTPAAVTFPYSDHIRSDWQTRRDKTPATTEE